MEVDDILAAQMAMQCISTPNNLFLMRSRFFAIYTYACTHSHQWHQATCRQSLYAFTNKVTIHVWP